MSSQRQPSYNYQASSVVSRNPTLEQNQALEAAAQFFLAFEDPEAAIDDFLNEYFDPVTGRWRSMTPPPTLNSGPVAFTPAETSSQTTIMNDVPPIPRLPNSSRKLARPGKRKASQFDEADQQFEHYEMPPSSTSSNTIGGNPWEQVHQGRYCCKEQDCNFYQPAGPSGRRAMAIHYTEKHPAIWFDFTKLFLVVEPGTSLEQQTARRLFGVNRENGNGDFNRGGRLRGGQMDIDEDGR